MSLGLNLAVGRSRRLTALSFVAAGLGVSGGALSGLHLWQAGAPLAGAGATVAVAVACLAVGIRCRKRVALGSLRVETDGLANWNCDGERSSLPFAPDRWLVAAGCAWITGTADGRRLHLLSGADEHTDRDWSRLMVWLRWLERGGGVRG